MDRIRVELLQNDIISLNESDNICKEDSPCKRNSMLLQVILRKDIPINIFLEILRNAQNGQKQAIQFNYAVSLERNGKVEDTIKVLEEMYTLKITERIRYGNDCDDDVEMGLLNFEREVSKELVGGHLLISHCKMGNREKMQEILEDRKFFRMIHSQEMMTTLLRILNSNLIQSNYTLLKDGPMLKFDSRGASKGIVWDEYIVDLLIPLPIDLQWLVLDEVEFKDGNSKDNMIDISDWLPKKLSRFEIPCYKSKKNILLSLGSIVSIKNLVLWNICSLRLDPVYRISPEELSLTNISIMENEKELRNVKINEFIDFHKMKRLELTCRADKAKISIDLSEESANIEYLRLECVTVESLKSADSGERVTIKEAEIESCSLDLSILPSSLQKLSISKIKPILVSGGIDLPNLKYLEFTNVDISDLSHFQSLQITHLNLNWVKELNVDILPSTVKVVRIDRDRQTKFLGGEIRLEKLILDGFPLTELEEILTHFHLKQLVVLEEYKPLDLIPLTHIQRPTIAIGWVKWGEDDSQNSIISKQVDRPSEYYLFHEGTGKAIQSKDFDELYRF